MRLTTKIIIGIILTIIVLSLLNIIVNSFSDRRYYTSVGFNKLEIPQVNTTRMTLEPYRVIVFETERTNDSRYFFDYKDLCGLFIKPITPSANTNELVFPEAMSDFIYAKTSNDTLIIKIKIDEIQKQYLQTVDETKKYRHPSVINALDVTGFYLHLYTSNVHVINKLHLPTYVNNIEIDSIFVSSIGNILLDSCKVIVFEATGAYNKKLMIKNSAIKTFYLDMDYNNHWETKDSDIESFEMTGSNNKYITLKGSEQGKINWRPKNKDAELNIKIKGEAAQINYQTQGEKQ